MVRDGFWLSAVAAGIGSALAVLGLLRWRRGLPVSRPDHRTLHAGDVPRVGGLAVWLGVALGLAASGALPPWAWVVVPLFAVFAVEDWRPLPALARLAVQVLAVGLFLGELGRIAPPGWLEGGILPEALGWALIGIAMLWMTNLYNFMDGSDGLAGLMTVAGFGAMAAAALSGEDTVLGAAAIAVAAAAAAFLPFNWHPARIFLGDLGAVPLGFVAAATALDGVAGGIWPFWFPVLVFLPFIVDASITLARRALQGRSVLEPHRDHCYQRLVRIGMGHAGTAVAYGAVMAGCCASALAALWWADEAGPSVLAGWCVALAALHWRVSRVWARSAEAE